MLINNLVIGYIQGDLASMVTPIFYMNKSFINILKDQFFQILKFFRAALEYPVVIQTFVFQMKITSPIFFTANYGLG